jgi:type VI secretion system protein
MALGQSLLERIDSGEKSGQQTLDIDWDSTAQSVLTHLRKMFNTRQDSAPAFPDYGMPDFNDVVSRFPHAIIEIRRAIRECLSKYEPRLTSVRVQYLPDEENPLLLKFEITAKLKTGEERVPVAYQTVLAADGRVDVCRG